MEMPSARAARNCVLSAALSRRRLAGTTALLLLAASPAALAQTVRQGCALVEGRMPAGCVQANQGTVVTRPVPPNVEPVGAAAALGDLGFSISIDSQAPTAAGQRERIAGDVPRRDPARDMDRLLERLGIQMSYDGLGARPMLNVSTADLRRSYAAGDAVAFRSFTNYPAWIARAEVIVADRDHRSRVVAVLPLPANGTATWTMPADGSAAMEYRLRVYDDAGRYDETVALPLDRSAHRQDDTALDGPIIAAGEAEDRTARRRIPVRGGAVTVTGQAVPAGTTITVMGEPVIPDAGRAFVLQRILPPGEHDLRIGVAAQGGGARDLSRPVSIAKSEWFTTGIADITIGRDFSDDDTFRHGRLSGFARGVTADGTRITASVDTREEELRDLFSNFGRKRPDQVLRQIEPRDVFATTGDDSVSEELASTTGKFYLRADHDRSHILWGDFKTAGDAQGLVRSDRTLYGLEGVYETPDTTDAGAARARLSGYVAQPDTLQQRDAFRGTGGTSYFLSRQDVLNGTETVLVELRDPVSGRVVEIRRLRVGQDYRIDYVQGVILLNAPLSSSVGGAGLINGRPLGDYDVNLIAQYEYVPTTGSVDGATFGGRAEVWVTETLRFGVSGISETTGVADNDLLGGDILLRKNQDTWLKLDYAVSEGPGFDSTFSLNSGMEIDPDPTAGASGRRADAFRAEGRIDLEEIGREGFIAGYFDTKEAGFTSPDHDITVDQDAWGIDGALRVAAGTDLTFGHEGFRNDDGKREIETRAGLTFALSEQLSLGTEVNHTERDDPLGGDPRDNGERTDLGARLTWTRDEDLSLWIFGHGDLARSGGIEANNRLGAGLETRLSEKLSVTGEASGGSLGAAGQAALVYAPNAGTRYNLGYRLDPVRSLDSDPVPGRDRGTIVVGASSVIDERWSYQAENTYSAFGNQPTLASSYGVTYTPGETWKFDGALQFGETTESDGTNIERTGLSFGTRYTDGEDLGAGIRGEVRFESSDNPARDLDRETYLLTGYYNRRTSEDWRVHRNLQNLARERLGLSALVEGRGMAYSREYIDRFGWSLALPTATDAIAHPTEDWRHGVRLVEHGYRVAFAEDAHVYTPLRETLSAATQQGMRWERGRMANAATHGLNVLGQAIRDRKVRMMFAALDAIQLPVAVLGAVTVLAGLLAVALPGPAWFRALGLAPVIMVGIYGIFVIAQGQREGIRASAIAWAPVYVLWRCASFVLAFVATGRR